MSVQQLRQTHLAAGTYQIQRGGQINSKGLWAIVVDPSTTELLGSTRSNCCPSSTGSMMNVKAPVPITEIYLLLRRRSSVNPLLTPALANLLAAVKKVGDGPYNIMWAPSAILGTTLSFLRCKAPCLCLGGSGDCEIVA